MRLDSCESDFGCLPARMIHQSGPIHNHPQYPQSLSYPLARCHMLRQNPPVLASYANIVPDCACTYSVRMVPSQGESGCARQYLFLEKASIEFMFLIGTRPAPNKGKGRAGKGKQGQQDRPRRADLSDACRPPVGR